MNYNGNHYIQNSLDYIFLSSLMEDFESLDKLARQRIAENNFSAALRCMNMMRLVLDELKSHIMQ